MLISQLQSKGLPSLLHSLQFNAATDSRQDLIKPSSSSRHLRRGLLRLHFAFGGIHSVMVFAHSLLDVRQMCPAQLHFRLAVFWPTSKIYVLEWSILFRAQSDSFTPKMLGSMPRWLTKTNISNLLSSVSEDGENAHVHEFSFKG